MKITPWNNYPIEFDEAEHCYRVNGVIKPAVGKLLSMVGLGLDFSKMGQVQIDNINLAGALGKSVHAWCEIIDKGEYDKYERTGGKVEPYLNAWNLFKAELKVSIIEIEGAHYSEYGDYCGRLDRVILIGKQLYLVDIKSAKSLNPTARLQTMGYTYFFKEPMKRMIVQVCEDGSYKIYDDGTFGKKWLYDDIDKKAWESVLTITNWQRNVK